MVGRFVKSVTKNHNEKQSDITIQPLKKENDRDFCHKESQILKYTCFSFSFPTYIIRIYNRQKYNGPLSHNAIAFLFSPEIL